MGRHADRERRDATTHRDGPGAEPLTTATPSPWSMISTSRTSVIEVRLPERSLAGISRVLCDIAAVSLENRHRPIFTVVVKDGGLFIPKVALEASCSSVRRNRGGSRCRRVSFLHH